MKRSSGILMHVSSLPSSYGIGTLGKKAYEFIDFLVKAEVRYWQVLPLGPTSYGDSPYAGFSSFAGNHYFIDLELLVSEGVIDIDNLKHIDFGNNPNKVDYGKLFKERTKILNTAYKNEISKGLFQNNNYNIFKQNESYWLNDYSLFMALKKHFNLIPWSDWPEDIKKRWNNALNYYGNLLSEEIEFQKYMQYKFFTQWSNLRKYANSKGIQIIGDMPIYVAADSADTWVNSHLFSYDSNKNLLEIAGCPPDIFSKEGQLWGNPVYNWNAHRNENFNYWISRFSMSRKLFDVIRLDHFRGFDTFWAIPYGSNTAANGKWYNGPGMELFNAVRSRLGHIDMIAEDLGILNDTSRKLLEDSKIPGMKILQFAFGSGHNNPYLPHNYKDDNCVVYTGTHDNNTTLGWYMEMPENQKNYAISYMNIKNDFVWETIETAFKSRAVLSIIQIQDYLVKDSSYRMNLPSTLSIDNWSYRVSNDELSDWLAMKIKNLVKRHNR